MILVEVSVTDAQGRPARGLRAEDFKLFEDGEERPLAFVNVERRGGVERPVAVVFAVDVSGSMTRGEARAGAMGLNAKRTGRRRFDADELRQSAKSSRPSRRPEKVPPRIRSARARRARALDSHLRREDEPSE